MNILIAGGTGLIGTALEKKFRQAGHQVWILSRQKSQRDNYIFWQPAQKIIQLDTDLKIDTVINLAGESIADHRWNKAVKKSIWTSRTQATELLAATILTMKHPPKVFLSSSAIGIYGNTSDSVVDEHSPAGSDFLAELALDWEHATETISHSSVRSVQLRTGVVLSPKGGVLAQMLLPFKLGLGGSFSHGNQYMSCISLPEIVNAIEFIIQTESIEGPVNLVAPEAITNRQFTATLASLLKRPAFFTIPAVVARLAFGEMADALLLSSSRVKPQVLIDHGYQFLDKDLRQALEKML
ncbi:MAG: TIGR01777 family oxidoreductase [Pseudomonadales bacterium]|nr:TIGR01777 family oxidoreductase [Pseudomonadales bacterium]